eukprot:EG_transcript_45794
MTCGLPRPVAPAVAPQAAQPLQPPPAGSVFLAADGTSSVVLEYAYHPEYEPTLLELCEYAQWLGMDPEQDADLLWIAREGLKAPLPEHWRPCRTATGEVYFFNFATGESMWDHPLDAHFKQLYVIEK